MSKCWFFHGKKHLKARDNAADTMPVIKYQKCPPPQQSPILNSKPPQSGRMLQPQLHRRSPTPDRHMH